MGVPAPSTMSWAIYEVRTWLLRATLVPRFCPRFQHHEELDPICLFDSYHCPCQWFHAANKNNNLPYRFPSYDRSKIRWIASLWYPCSWRWRIENVLYGKIELVILLWSQMFPTDWHRRITTDTGKHTLLPLSQTLYQHIRTVWTGCLWIWRWISHASDYAPLSWSISQDWPRYATWSFSLAWPICFAVLT